ncbi:hypothetical protein JCM16303_002724 [Sporobolomyces ruberrimus]
MSGIPQRDFISYLPYEILAKILEHAFKDVPPPRSPISRAFLPFQRRALLRSVKITSSSQLDKLVEASAGNSCLGGMVTAFEAGSTSVKGIKDDRRLKTFFPTLVNLQRLKLYGLHTSLVELFSSLNIGPSESPRLNELDYTFHRFSTDEQPFEPRELLYHLTAYPSLRRLDIMLYSKYDTFNISSWEGSRLPGIDELVLKGVSAHLIQPTFCFLLNFPNLTSLSLDSLWCRYPDYALLVLTFDVSLTSLALLTRGTYDDFSKPCDRGLAYLVNLEYLYLGAGTYSDDLVDTLRKLTKLKTLGFGYGRGLSVMRLEELSIGPNALGSLKKIIFDQVEGKIGWKIAKDSDGKTLHPDASKSQSHLGPGWNMPLWSPKYPASYEEDAMLALVTRIRSKGIKVEGNTVKAFGVLEEWVIEVKMCAMAHAYTTGESEECRRKYGEEFVDAQLEAWGSAPRRSESM